jgi:CDGSH-type Zn-finger protein
MSEPTLKIELIPNGPAMLTTDKAVIRLSDGTVVEKEGRFSLCRCGWSENKPYCDGSHKGCGFKG